MAWTQAETAHTVTPKAVKRARLTAQLSLVLGVRADPVQRGGKNERNVLRLSQVMFVYTRRQALECSDMRPAYVVRQGFSGVFTQELLEMAL